MKQKVIVNIKIEDDDDRPMAELELIVDGKKIGSEQIGGEPEDNSYQRDYGWIPLLMLRLGEALGAEVELNETEKED